ncbi:MAG TPA: hypothetical protein VFZ91_04470 [Allosphingosinicella sp.]
MNIRLKQLSFGSQVKAVLAVGLATAAVIFILFLGLQVAGLFAGGGGDAEPVPVVMIGLAFASLVLAAFVALLQVAALCLLRLVPWRGPSLKVRQEVDLARVFE